MTIQTEHSVEQGPAASVGDDFPQVADPFRRELLAHKTLRCAARKKG